MEQIDLDKLQNFFNNLTKLEKRELSKILNEDDETLKVVHLEWNDLIDEMENHWDWIYDDIVDYITTNNTSILENDELYKDLLNLVDKELLIPCLKTSQKVLGHDLMMYKWDEASCECGFIDFVLEPNFNQDLFYNKLLNKYKAILRDKKIDSILND